MHYYESAVHYYMHHLRVRFGCLITDVAVHRLGSGDVAPLSAILAPKSIRCGMVLDLMVPPLTRRHLPRGAIVSLEETQHTNRYYTG